MVIWQHVIVIKCASMATRGTRARGTAATATGKQVSAGAINNNSTGVVVTNNKWRPTKTAPGNMCARGHRPQRPIFRIARICYRNGVITAGRSERDRTEETFNVDTQHANRLRGSRTGPNVNTSVRNTIIPIVISNDHRCCCCCC